jgi:hypothetical protein
MPRICYYIPPTQTPDPGSGYRVAIVEEDNAGYRWTGDAPEGGRQQPYYWGSTLAEAEAVARGENRRLGLTDDDVLHIVNSSIWAQLAAEAKRGTIH